MESITRLRLHDDGFPDPVLQCVLGGFRVDFYWPSLRLVLEADGRVKYADVNRRPDGRDPLWHEKNRERALRRLGLRVERVTWADVVPHWSATSQWLRPLMCLPRASG